jgi:hypothetical protein
MSQALRSPAEHFDKPVERMLTYHTDLESNIHPGRKYSDTVMTKHSLIITQFQSVKMAPKKNSGPPPGPCIRAQ